MSDETFKNEARLELTTSIISSYVSNNPVPATELTALIKEIHQTLSDIVNDIEKPEAEIQQPAINPKRSVHDDYIVCLEDGKKFKSLKRHIAAYHGLSPDEYRAKWGLPEDYPMVAPKHSAARSEFAKKIGLGRKPEAKPGPMVAPVKRGRKPKAA